MREAFDKIFGPLADAVEIRSRSEWWAKAIFFFIFLWPTSGYVWQQHETLERLLALGKVPSPAAILTLALWAVSGILFVFLFIKGLQLHLPTAGALRVVTPSAPTPTAGATPDMPTKTGSPDELIAPFDFTVKKIRFKRDEDPQVTVGDMVFTEKDLYTSCLITGVTGTGKTSAAVFPMLDQILSIYNEDGPGPLGSIGGLCLDVKGEFFEGVIYYMHRAGRNIFEDIQVIRPSCLMPIVRFKDPATGYFFYLNAKSCSSGAEAWDLIRGKKFKDGSDIPLNIFTFTRRKLDAADAKLKELVFDVSGKKLNYLGWRFQGDRMTRISHTPRFNETHVMKKDGKRITIDAPRTLVYDGVTFVDNNLRYNIVEPHKPAPEAAMRLNLIATLAEGEKATGENAYWYKRARAHIGSCIDLWRSAYDETPQCTAQSIYKVTQQDDFCKKQTKIVEGKIKGIQDQLMTVTDFGDRVSLEREVERMTSIVKYFSEEWGKYDSKTKTIIGSVVANAFDTFNKDPVLQDSFCQPKTFSFEQCIQEGKIFVLVAGDEYETVAKILGTALKMDFQSVVLSRMHRSELNQKRKIMMVNDECQKFVVAGGSQGAGDEHFMSLCRQSKCFNINATQADSWIISVVGKENSDVYLQNYNGRIWFRTNDKETAEKGEQLCGIKKQKTRSAGNEKAIHLENLFLGAKGSADHTPSFSEKEEDKPRFAKDKFYNLEMWECIVFNGTRTGADKACQSQCEPAIVTGDEGKVAVAETMRLYFQGYLENLAYKQNGGKVFDHIPEPKVVQGTSQTITAATELPPIPTLNAAPNVPSSGTTQAPIPVAGAPITVGAAPQATSSAPVLSVPVFAAPPALSTFGEPEALKTRANKLLKSVQIIAPRVSNVNEGTQAPFVAAPTAAPTPNTTTPAASPVVTAQPAAKPSAPPPVTPVASAAPTPVVTPEAPTSIPVIDKNFSPDNVTPRQLQVTMQEYQNGDGTQGLQEALKDANFIAPINPSEYLIAKKEEENSKVSNEGLASERAALGPKGLQGGNPNVAMAAGGSIKIPAPPTDAFELAREQAVKEERELNAKAFISAINKQDGPKPDVDTLELLKNLKPETGGESK